MRTVDIDSFVFLLFLFDSGYGSERVGRRQKRVKMIGFVLPAALMVALIWGTGANAQRPIEAQHKEPEAPSGPALGASGVSVGDVGAAGEELQPVTSGASGLKARILSPIGRLIIFVYAGVLVASVAGLVLLRRSGKGT
jgi:hypothetical protein